VQIFQNRFCDFIRRISTEQNPYYLTAGHNKLHLRLATAYSYITQIRTWVFGRCVEFTLLETFVKMEETAQGVFSFLEILVSLFAI
jgi:hypothetical protein